MARRAFRGNVRRVIPIRARPPRQRRVEVRRGVPPGLTSEYEARTWLALTALGYQPRLQAAFRGGTDFSGGLQVDFLLLEIMTVVRVQSYWHLDPASQQRDEYQRTYLQALGYQVVDVPGDDLPTVDQTIAWLRGNLGRPI
jgi:hypothetical protein